MKLTKSKLKQIIAEELNGILLEDYDYEDEWANQLEETIDSIQKLAKTLENEKSNSIEYVRKILHGRLDEYINEDYIKRNLTEQ